MLWSEPSECQCFMVSATVDVLYNNLASYDKWKLVKDKDRVREYLLSVITVVL